MKMKIQDEPMSKTDIIIKKILPIFLALGYKVNEMFFERNYVDLLIYKQIDKIFAETPEWIVKVTTDTINITKKFDLFKKMMNVTECTKGLVMNEKQFIYYSFYFSSDGHYTNDTRELFQYATTEDILTKLKKLMKKDDR